MFRLLKHLLSSIPAPRDTEIANRYGLNPAQRKIFYEASRAINQEMETHFRFLEQRNYSIVSVNLIRAERKQEFLLAAKKIMGEIKDQKVKHALVEVAKISKLLDELPYYNDFAPKTRVYYDRVISLREDIDTLSIDEIITELKSIRKGLKTIPNIPPWSEYSLYVYEIFSSLHKRKDLTLESVSDLVDMLTWRENSMKGCHMDILFVVKDHPSNKFRDALQRHLEWVISRREGANIGSQDYAEFSSEKRYIEEEILPLCT